MKVAEITFLSPLEEANSENDNIDVHVRLDDGRIFSFVFATPNNLFWCMANEGLDYYFGVPTVFVRVLNKECIEKAIQAILSENKAHWLDVYGTLQSFING